MSRISYEGTVCKAAEASLKVQPPVPAPSAFLLATLMQLIFYAFFFSLEKVYVFVLGLVVFVLLSNCVFAVLVFVFQSD